MLAMSKGLSIAIDLLPHPIFPFLVEDSAPPLHMERGKVHLD